MHSLDDVPTVVKYPADIFRVHSARKMRVTVMASVSACRADPLLESKRITLEMKNANAANVAVISHAQFKFQNSLTQNILKGIHCIIKTPTRNSSRMKYLALVTLGSSPGSGVAERIQTHKGMILSGAIMVNRISVGWGRGEVVRTVF